MIIRQHPAAAARRHAQYVDHLRVAKRRRSISIVIMCCLVVMGCGLFMAIWPGAVLLLLDTIGRYVASLL